MHSRRQIRDAIVARLKSANTNAGQNVFGSRAAPLFKTQLPAILVYTKTETAEVSIDSPREYQRNLVVALELVASAKTEDLLDDALDDLAEQVEISMFAEETLGGLVTDTVLVETEIELLQEGEQPIGAAKISLSMPYFQQLPGDLTGALDALERIDTKIDLPPADGTSESEDLQDIPQ